jgi:hypothetical protein
MHPIHHTKEDFEGEGEASSEDEDEHKLEFLVLRKI